MLTVLCGLILPILRAFSMACAYGLQTIGVFGKDDVEALGWEKCATMSKISVLALVVLEDDLEPVNWMSSSSSETMFLWTGFRVSKHMIPSKQSSKPRMLSALTAWTLSAFVKIWFTNYTAISIYITIRLLYCIISFYLCWSLTTLRIGKLSKRLLRTGSGFRFSYGILPWTKLQNRKPINN